MNDAPQVMPPSVRWQIGASGFFMLATVFMLALLSLTIGLLYYEFDNIQKSTMALREQNLPSLLENQRVRHNLAVLQSNAEKVYISENPRIRREGMLTARSLASEVVFERSQLTMVYTATILKQMHALDAVRWQGNLSAAEASRHEIGLAALGQPLCQALGLESPFLGEDAASAQFTPEGLPRPLLTQATMEPLLRQCRGSALPDRHRAQCDALSRQWRLLLAAREKTAQADADAQKIWSTISMLLESAVQTSSSLELSSTMASMDDIEAQVKRARRVFFLAVCMLGGIVLVFVATVHRHFLAPVTMAARALHDIRLGRPGQPLAAVRIRELQALLDVLPSLRAQLTALSQKTGKLTQEKNVYANLSLRDALTNIGNRRSFDMHMGFASRHPELPLALLMLDVDFFKQYNDSLGHQAGDICLRKIASALVTALRQAENSVFRYGGEEFAIILVDVGQQQAQNIAERILEGVRACAIPHPSSCIGPVVTVSVGISVKPAGWELDTAALVAKADAALYRAKSTGRNKACLS